MSKQRKLSVRERLIMQLNDRFCGKAVNVTFETDWKGDLISKGSKTATNSFNSDPEQVMATYWFNDYWFYISIQVIPESREKDKLYTSVSFFQNIGDSLKQLFRAEWDSYKEQGDYSHPQPHWHFTAQLSDVTSFSELENMEEEGEFNRLLGNSKTINLDKMHFSMAGDWINTGDMIAKPIDENTLVDWLIRLFVHVREELNYKET